MMFALYFIITTQSLTKKMLNLTNTYRSDQCMKILKEHRSLVRAAQAQADKMCLYNRFMGKNEKELSNSLLKYDYVGQNIGENTAREQGDDYKEVFRIWKEHEDYNKNLLGDFENIGIGTCTSDDGKRYWVLLFGKKLNRNKEETNECEKRNDRIILVLNSSDKKHSGDTLRSITLDVDDDKTSIKNPKTRDNSTSKIDNIDEKTLSDNNMQTTTNNQDKSTKNANTDGFSIDTLDSQLNSKTETISPTKSSDDNISKSSKIDIASLINEGLKKLQSSILNNIQSMSSNNLSTSINIVSLQSQMTDVLSCISNKTDTSHMRKPISQTVTTSQINSELSRTNDMTKELDILDEYTKPFSSLIDEITDSVASIITTTIFITSSSGLSDKKKPKSTHTPLSSMFDKFTSEIYASDNENNSYNSKMYEDIKTDSALLSKVSSILENTDYLQSIKDLCKDETKCNSFFATEFANSDGLQSDASTSRIDLPETSSNTSNDKQDRMSNKYDTTESKTIDRSDTNDTNSLTRTISSSDASRHDTPSKSVSQTEIDKSKDKRHTQVIIADIEGRIINYGDCKIPNVVDKRNIKNNKSEQIEKTIDDLRKILNSRNINDHNIKIIVADDKCDEEANAEVGNSLHLGD